MRSHNTVMGDFKRATVYFDPTLHEALRLKAAQTPAQAAQTEDTVSGLVNSAVRRSLAENAEDLAAFDTRTTESSLDFEDVLQELRRRGKL